MKKLNFKNVIRQSVLGLSVLSMASQASAISVDWSGTYRFEYTQVDKTSLDSPSLRKNYILNYLSLSPKIVAADGMNIVAKFDVLPNDQYPDSQAGQPFGRGPEKANAGGSSSTEDSAVAGNRQGSSNLVVRQLYFNMLQEYGSFLIGRAPLDFGLGINYSAGNGLFDHWYNTRDMVGYKFIIGNFSLMPIIGKVSDYSVSQGQEAQDMIWDVAYNNPETESAIGIMHQTRTSSTEANDAPLGYGGPTGGNRQGAWKTQKISIFLSRGFEDLKFKIEAGFESGSTGIFTGTSGGEEVELNGYGIAMELELPQPESRWHYNLRAGIASGDNPTTTNYEGFHFNRNYDVAFLMFNHPMGRLDAFRTGIQRGPNRLPGGCTTAPCPPYATDEALDDETISNAIYVSPKAVYNINDKWDWANSVTWAQLQTDPLGVAGNEVSKDVGFEWDTGLVYRPHERVTWVNELGLFFPGAAWKGGSNEFGTGFNFGFNSKAAISF